MDSSLLTLVVAGGVLVVAAVVLLVGRPRAVRDVAIDAREATFTGSTPISPAAQPDAKLTLAAAEAIGQAMTQAGYSVETVQNALAEIAHVNGLPDTEALVFPSAVLVSARGSGQHQTGAVASQPGRLLLSQIDQLQRTVDAARTGLLDPQSVVEKVSRIRDMTPTYGPVIRVVAYGFLSGALSVLLGATWNGVALAAALGLVAGTTLLITERLPRRYAALNTVALSFGVALAVFLLLRTGLGYGILPALLAPLVLLLPGTLLTTAMLELATGHLISGAGRLAGGATQLLLLGSGIVTAAVVVGIPDVNIDIEGSALGPIAPWIAVAVLGVGISVHSSAPRRALPWMLLVLYVAYAVQVLSDQLVGGILSAFIGALVVTPVTGLVARMPTGPAALVTFTAGYWLLVPGALGLVGVTSLLEQDAAAAASLLATLSTMLAIALGVLAGSVISYRLDRPAL